MCLQGMHVILLLMPVIHCWFEYALDNTEIRWRMLEYIVLTLSIFFKQWIQFNAPYKHAISNYTRPKRCELRHILILTNHNLIVRWKSKNYDYAHCSTHIPLRLRLRKNFTLMFTIPALKQGMCVFPFIFNNTNHGPAAATEVETGSTF